MGLEHQPRAEQSNTDYFQACRTIRGECIYPQTISLSVPTFRSCVNVWIHGLDPSLLKDVYYSSVCADVYETVSKMSGVPSNMLTLSNGVRILRRNAQLHNYILPGNLSHGLNLHCYVKTLGGDSGDELGK